MDYVEIIISGIAGLLLGVLFEDRLKFAYERFRKQIQIWFYRPKSSIHSPETFSIGKLATSWLVIDGDGSLTYIPKTIKCLVKDTQTDLPSEIKQLKKRIEEREEAKRRKGLSSQWNGPLYSLERYAISRTVPDENMQVTFTFRPTDYFTFQATVMSLDVNLVEPPAIFTLRQKYLKGHDLSQPISFLANGFGIALIIISSDRKLILGRRQNYTGARPSELDVSVVEGVHPLLDRASNHRGPDLYRTAIRGTQEEVGIELIDKDITFLGFGVDIEYYQWSLIGVAHIPETAEQALENRKRGTGGKWETKKYEIVDSDPRNVFYYLTHEMGSRKIWSTAIVTVYWALVHEYGKRRVELAAKDIFT